MNQFEEREYTKVRKVLIAVSCNKCGKEFKYPYIGEATSVCIDFGYGSKFDTERWQFHLCDDCFENWVKDFVCPVSKDDDISYAEDIEDW